MTEFETTKFKDDHPGDILGGGFNDFLGKKLWGKSSPNLTNISFRWVETTN